MAGKRFSILEISVGVVFVLGLLFLGLSILDGGKEERRDQQRISDINEWRKGLDLYRANTGEFPISPEPTALSGTDAVSQALKDGVIFTKVPTDPLHPEFSYWYQSTTNGDDYLITFCQETDAVTSYKQGCENAVRP